MRIQDYSISILSVLILVSGCASQQTDKSSYLAVAEKAAIWLDAAKIQTGHGLAWPADPQDSTSVVTNLYSGSAGVVLFFLEAYRTTENPLYLENAQAGANDLIASLPDTTYPGWAGLYTGVSGIGFVLAETYKMTGEEKYLEAALRCVNMLHEKANRIGSGVEWNAVTDIISGSAGIGLFLIYAANELEHETSLELAKQAGIRLMTYALPEKGGLKWPMSASFPRLMPNFSHGTAGVAYFLAELYEQSKDGTFLQAALKGAEYLLTSAETDSNAGLIFHHEPEGEDLLIAQSGYMQGAAGIGMLLLNLDSFEQGRKRSITFPDSPF